MIWARDDLGPVADDDASHDLGQLVFALEPSPGLRRCHDDLDPKGREANTISLAVIGESAPLVRTVRCRTVANTLSMGLVVRR